MYNWREDFNERNQKEIEFAELYSKNFNHGTDGHNRLLLIAEMAEYINTIQEELDSLLEKR